MAKKALTKRCAEVLRDRPVLGVRYRVTTALYKGTESEEPRRITAHKGAYKIDFVALFAAVFASRICLKLLFKLLARYIAKKKKK